jgi:DNA-binding NarL/FixJ family response regulator
MPPSKPIKTPRAKVSTSRSQKTDAASSEIAGLHALLQMPPKSAVVLSRDLVDKNKSDILKALRRGHRVDDIAKALSIPNRTFVRRLSELNISARLVRKQYQRLG